MDAREERRLVACLFIDVVGSTELTVRLGPERLKAALGAAFAELRSLIEREGGTIEKYVGDEIYALFGAPIAHEDDPTRALRAADAVRGWGRSRGSADVPFAVRVGLEVGEAVVDLAATEGARQQMSVGAVVNVAARLQSHADPGQVLVGPVAHRATEEIAAYTSLGEVDLKGLGRMPVWQLVEVHRQVPQRRVPFVGRRSELELLRLASRRAASRSVLALVSGPPGQGKTRLVEEFLSSLPETVLLKARSRPGGEIGTLTPLRELLLGDEPESELDALVARAVAEPADRGRIRDALAHSAGIAASGELASIGKDERDDEIQNAWRRLARGLGAGRPLVIWVEDVHWAAPEIVRLLDRLSLSGDPLMVIATARPEFAQAAGLRLSGDRFFIELEGLEPDEARALAANAGSSVEGGLVRAEGNPLFIVELARARDPAGELPLTLQGALGARLDELDTDDRALLARAAVIGETFAAQEAAVLSGRPAQHVARALARLADLHYLDPVDGRFRFYHSLLRDVAYGRLLVADRMRLHARYAREAAERDDPEVLAHHWWQAFGSPDAEWVWRDEPDVSGLRRAAFRAQLDAGRRSAELFAVERAVQLFERAFILAANDRERGDTKRALADAYAFDLRADESWRSYAEARTHYAAAGDVPAEVYLGALKIRMRLGAFNAPPTAEEVKALEHEAEAAARATGDQSALARILVYSAFADMDPASEHGDSERILEAVRLTQSADLDVRREILGWFADDLLRRHELERAATVLEQIEGLGVVTNELDRMEQLRGRAVLANRAGDLPGLASVADRLVAMSRRMGPHLRTHADVFAAYTALAKADWEQLIGLGGETDRLMRSAPGTAFCSSAATVLALAAVAHARAGRADDARALGELIGATNRAMSPLAAEGRSMRDLRSLALVFTGATVDPQALSGTTGAVTAVAIRAHDRALAIAESLESQSHGGARLYAALAEAIREEVAHDRGGPRPEHRSLRAIGFVGWSELLRARAMLPAAQEGSG